MGKKILSLRAVLVASAIMMVALSIAAADDRECPPAVIGEEIHGNVVVPNGQTCFIIGATVHGNVKALEDSQLIVISSTVDGGDIEGDKASEVQVRESRVLGGNIHITEAHDPRFVSALVLFSHLSDGNIHIKKGRHPSGDWGVRGNIVEKGDIIIEENGSSFGLAFPRGRRLNNVSDNRVGGNMQVRKNFGNSEKFVDDNTVGGNIQIEDNVVPIVGGVTSRMSILRNATPSNLQVYKNRGRGLKEVVSNTVGQDLQCFENEPPFIGGPNTAGQAQGQCFTGDSPPPPMEPPME